VIWAENAAVTTMAARQLVARGIPLTDDDREIWLNCGKMRLQ
jgi:gluconate kinase